MGLNILKETESRLNIILLRCSFSFIVIAMLYGSVQFIPISIAILLFKLSPIYLAILSRYFVKEKVSLFDYAGLFLALIGMGLITLGNIQNEGKN